LALKTRPFIINSKTRSLVRTKKWE